MVEGVVGSDGTAGEDAADESVEGRAALKGSLGLGLILAAVGPRRRVSRGSADPSGGDCAGIQKDRTDPGRI